MISVEYKVWLLWKGIRKPLSWEPSPFRKNAEKKRIMERIMKFLNAVGKLNPQSQQRRTDLTLRNHISDVEDKHNKFFSNVLSWERTIHAKTWQQWKLMRVFILHAKIRLTLYLLLCRSPWSNIYWFLIFWEKKVVAHFII